jgi:hypothetical protein
MSNVSLKDMSFKRKSYGEKVGLRLMGLALFFGGLIWFGCLLGWQPAVALFIVFWGERV